MVDLSNINSLSDFNRNSKEHVERLRESGEPEVLTVNGKAELVIQDASSYAKLLRKADFADAVSSVHRGMKAHAKSGGKSLRKALQELAEESGFSLE